MHCLTWPPPAAQSETAASARVGCLTSVCSFSTDLIILTTIHLGPCYIALSWQLYNLATL